MVNEADSVVTGDRFIHGAMKKIVLHINQRQIAEDCQQDSTIPENKKGEESARRKLKLYESIISEIGARLESGGFQVSPRVDLPPFKKVTPVVAFLFCDEAMAKFITQSINEKPIHGLSDHLVLTYDRELDSEWLRY